MAAPNRAWDHAQGRYAGCSDSEAERDIIAYETEDHYSALYGRQVETGEILGEYRISRERAGCL